MHIIAHRGASFIEPENTLRSIRRAIDLDADMVEVDVRVSKDRKLVVIHDEKVDRTTDANGYVKDLEIRELKEFDAGLGEEIPTLDEVLEVFKDIGKSVKLIVEIKIPKIEKLVLDNIHKAGFEQVLLTSFYHPTIKNVKNLDPDMETGIIFACQPIKAWKLALDADADVIFPRSEFVDNKMIESAHKHMISVYPWTIDERDRAKALIKMGVDGIVTNKLIDRI